MNKLVSVFFIAVLQFARANDACQSRFHLISSVTQSQCPVDIKDTSKDPPVTTHKYYLFHDGGEHECFPYCKAIKVGLATSQLCTEQSPCPPGYLCQGQELKAHCVLDENSCFKYTVNYDSKDKAYSDAWWKPVCLPDGTWAPKQCKGEKFTGRCFCFDAIGNRIDGHQWATKSENMTCACSRRRSELMKSQRSFVTLHCDDEGNYEPLQCNDGQCWCADARTGEVTSKIVVEAMWKMLPCYDVHQNGGQYLRQCESAQYAQKMIFDKLQTHGTVGFRYDSILCDADGTYGVYKIGDGRATCTWKDNEPLGSFQTDLSAEDIGTLDCKCARDLKLYQMAGLDPEIRGRCTGGGSYEPVQMKVMDDGKRKYYCVDSDGFQKSDFMDIKPRNCHLQM